MEKKSFLQKMLALYQSMLSVLLLKQSIDGECDEVYRVAKLCLGKDMSPVQGVNGCAEAVNSVVKLAVKKEVGGGASTWLMYNCLIGGPKRFKKLLEVDAKVGDIIISPSGLATNPNAVPNGHVGILSDNGKIMSNNSANSLWDEHLDRTIWKARYRDFGGYPVYFFRIMY